MLGFWTGFVKQAEAVKQVATVALISVNDRKMLMGKRRDNKRWTTPGGHLEKNEDPYSGAVREVKEETGIDLGEDDLIHVDSKTVTKPNGTKLKIHAFKSFVNGPKPDTTTKEDPDKEISIWRWFKMRGGLPQQVLKNLHVPMPDNVLLKKLNFTKSASARQDLIDPRLFQKIFNESLQQYAKTYQPGNKKEVSKAY